MKKKRTLNLSAAEISRRRKQAKINFSLSKKRSKTGIKTTIKNGVTKIARRRYYRRVKKHYARHKGTYGLAGLAISAAIYGAGREKVSQAVLPISQKMGLGSYSDEVGMGILSFVVAKYTKGMLKQIGKAGLTIEAARIGSQMLSGISLGKTTTNNQQGLF